MRNYYQITEALYDFLKSNEYVNTVNIGNLDSVDLNKANIYPLAQIIVGDVSFSNGTLSFSNQVLIMDTIYEPNSEVQTAEDLLKGLDNKQDVYNSTLSVVNKLQANLKAGNLHESKFHLDGQPTATPFEDQYSNGLCGWSLQFNVMVPNDEVSVCDYSIPTACSITFDSTNLSFDATN